MNVAGNTRYAKLLQPGVPELIHFTLGNLMKISLSLLKNRLKNFQCTSGSPLKSPNNLAIKLLESKVCAVNQEASERRIQNFNKKLMVWDGCRLHADDGGAGGHVGARRQRLPGRRGERSVRTSTYNYIHYTIYIYKIEIYQI